jgi:predicted PurR-regulated permease PerM
MGDVARKAAVASLVVVGVVALSLALWELRLVLALLFLAFILAAAMRPAVDALARAGVPRGVGVAAHYVCFALLLAGFLWIAVPQAVDQIDGAVASLPETRSQLGQEARESTGLKHDVLLGLQRRLQDLPSGKDLTDPAVEITLTVAEVFVGIFFVLASAAYWIFERERAERLVCSLVPSRHAQTVRDTWRLIDLKLGAYVRGQALLILLVGTVLSLVFWAIGMPYWILVGAFAGLVEIVPVIGPLVAGAVAVGVGLTESWEVALLAGIAVLVVRLLEDYLVIPRLLGDAVGLTPLVVLVSVTTTGLLFGGFAIILAIPLAAVGATLVDVVVRDKDPAEEEVPTVLFPAKDAETVGG